MRPMRAASAAVFAVTAGLFGPIRDARAQPPAPHHGGTTLFLVQATGNKVTPPSSSTATATGAFLVDPAARAASYEVTYVGLQHGPAQSIALYNFGEGGNGQRVHTICGGEGARACPEAAYGNLTGSWNRENPGRVPLDAKLLAEIASARVYLEIVGGDGKPEIRGQLEPNGAMVPVRNFVAHLASTSGSSAVGTAVLSEVHFPNGRVSVLYQFTVAGTSGPPLAAALVGTAEPGRTPGFRLGRTLPTARIRAKATGAAPAPLNGGTMTSQYDVRRDQRNAVAVTTLLSGGNREVGISVRTSRFPNGELYGAFKPVN